MHDEEGIKSAMGFEIKEEASCTEMGGGLARGI